MHVLRTLREERFLSQRELARRARVSPKTVLDIELGRVTPYGVTVRKLAAALEVDLSVFRHCGPPAGGGTA
jgi:transcriptional regulator with XRE-family HTH domain